jgi:hypothetical protein
MSQIHLTDSERAQALVRLGYSLREAEFLTLAALHGGYFLRRQYCRFLGSGSAALLIEKLLTLGHGQATTYARQQPIYHLCARPFYAAIGQEDNRNRRLRQPITIKNKLMGFDFVLQHLGFRYLATEQDKIAYFCGDLALRREFLPTKRYAASAASGQPPSERYFVEKFPIFLDKSSAPAAPPVVAFCFVDEGCATVSGFSTFLRQYAGLFRRLREYRVVYVAGKDGHFEAARAFWQRFSLGLPEADSLSVDEADLPRLLAHFEMRFLFEAREWASFDRAKLIRFREGEREFSGERYAVLYRRWVAGGRQPSALCSAESRPAPQAHGSFETCRLEENYDFFG